MNITFDIKMTTNAMYDYLLYHAYRRSNGYIGPILGTIALLYGVSQIGQKDVSEYFIWIFFGILFYLLTPVSLLLKAKTQVLTPMFQKPIHYQLDDEGIQISQEGEKAEFKWKDMEKAVSTKQSIIIYVAKTRAFILPKRAIGIEYDNVLKLIFTKMSPDKVKIKS